MKIERLTWKHTVPHVTQIASGNLLCDTEPHPVFGDNLEGCDGVGDGSGGSGGRGHMSTCG